MKTLRVAILMLTCTGTARGAVSVLHVASGQSSASAITLAITVTSTTSGNLLVAACGNGGTRTVSSVTDNQAQTWTQATSANAINSTREIDFYYKTNTAAAVTTVTCTYSGTAGTFNKDGAVIEVSGFVTPIQDTQNTIAGTGSGTTETGAAVTTTSTSGFIVAATETSANSIVTNPKSGNEFISGGAIFPTSGDAIGSLDSVTATTHTPAWTDNGTNQGFAASTLAFKETASTRNCTQLLLHEGPC